MKRKLKIHICYFLVALMAIITIVMNPIQNFAKINSSAIYLKVIGNTVFPVSTGKNRTLFHLLKATILDTSDKPASEMLDGGNESHNPDSDTVTV